MEYRALDWRTETLGETFDRVIASDVLYEKHQPEIVARAIAEGLRPGGRFMLTDPGRPYLQDFSDAMERRGLPVRIQTLTVPDPGAETPPVEGRTRDVFVLSGSRLLQ